MPNSLRLTAAASIAALLTTGLLTATAVYESARPLAASARGGQIAGRVTEHGKPLKGICVELLSPTIDTFGNAATSADGRYELGRIPAGRYNVAFMTGCGNNGNWVQARVKAVAVRAGKTTTGVNAALQLGGEISGTVTNAAGHPLNRICTVAAATGQPGASSGGIFRSSPGGSTRGVYQLRGVAPGSYKVMFIPCELPSPYAPEWWHNTRSQGAAGVLRIRSGQLIGNVNTAMPVGAVISGSVADAAAAPLAGVCTTIDPVGVLSLLQVFTSGDGLSTNSAGQYQIEGLPAGSYHVEFQANEGCSNGGDYVPTQSATIKTELGQTYAGVNEVMQRERAISGAVISAATG